MEKLPPHNHKVPPCLRADKLWVPLSLQDLRGMHYIEERTQVRGQRRICWQLLSFPVGNQTTVFPGPIVGGGALCFMSTHIYRAHTLSMWLLFQSLCWMCSTLPCHFPPHSLPETPTAQQAGFRLNVTSGKLSRLWRLGYIPLIDVPITFDISSYHKTHRGDFQRPIYFLIITSSKGRTAFCLLRHPTALHSV